MARWQETKPWLDEREARMQIISEAAEKKYGNDLGSAFVNFVTKKDDKEVTGIFCRVLANSESIQQITRAQSLELLVYALEGRARTGGRTILSYLEETLGIK